MILVNSFNLHNFFRGLEDFFTASNGTKRHEALAAAIFLQPLRHNGVTPSWRWIATDSYSCTYFTVKERSQALTYNNELIYTYFYPLSTRTPIFSHFFQSINPSGTSTTYTIFCSSLSLLYYFNRNFCPLPATPYPCPPAAKNPA